MNGRQALLAGAKYLENDGWGQNSYSAPCAVGAINMAVEGSFEGRSNAEFRANDRFRASIGMSLYSYNDTPGRTKAQVIRAMRHAARPFPFNRLPF